MEWFLSLSLAFVPLLGIAFSYVGSSLDIPQLLHRQLPGAIPESWEQEAGGNYEVLFRKNETAGQMTFDAKGQWLETRHFVPEEALPQLVQAILHSLLGDYFVLYAQAVSNAAGQVFYAVEAEGYEADIAERIEVTAEGLILSRIPLANQGYLPSAN